MVAQIAITGSGTSSVSPAQGSASAGSSFTDLLQSMVQSPSATSAHIASSPADCSLRPGSPQSSRGSAEAVHADTTPAESQPKAGDAPANTEQVAEPATNKPGTEESNPAPATRPGKDSADRDDISAEPRSPEDDDDPLAGLALLSVIPAGLPAAAVNAEPLETGNADSTAEVAAVAPASISAASAAATTDTIATNVIATDADARTTAAEVAENDADAAALTAEKNPSADFADELSAATDTAPAGDTEDVPAGEPSSKASAHAAEKLTPEKQVNDGASHATPTKDVAATEVDVAKAAQASPDAANQAPAPAADSKAAAQPAGQKAQSAQGVRATLDRSKERASSRPAESEGSARPDSKASDGFSSASIDANAVSAMQGSKGSDSTAQQEIPLQSAAAANHSAKVSDSRSAEGDGSNSFLRTASDASPIVQTPDQSSWMSSVRLMERISQSEMRVGIQTELGDVAVRTAMNRHELSAEISVQHSGLRDAIVAEIPSLQSRLSAQQIPMADVSVTADAGGGAGSFQQSAQDGRSMARYSAAANNNESSVTEHEPVAPVEVLGRSAGLDVRI